MELELEKIDERGRPTRIGEVHPDKPQVGKKHVDGKLSWYNNPQQSASDESFIKQNKEAFIAKHPPEHRPIIRHFIDTAMASPTRHAIPAGDKHPEDLKVRARHIKGLLQGREGTIMGVAHPKHLAFVAVRHGEHGAKDGLRTDSWTFTDKGFQKTEAIYEDEQKIRHDAPSSMGEIIYQGSISLVGSDDGREDLRKAWVLPVIAKRILRLSEKVRSLGLHKNSNGTESDLEVPSDRRRDESGHRPLVLLATDGVPEVDQNPKVGTFSELKKGSEPTPQKPRRKADQATLRRILKGLRGICG